MRNANSDDAVERMLNQIEELLKRQHESGRAARAAEAAFDTAVAAEAPASEVEPDRAALGEQTAEPVAEQLGDRRRPRVRDLVGGNGNGAPKAPSPADSDAAAHGLRPTGSATSPRGVPHPGTLPAEPPLPSAADERAYPAATGADAIEATEAGAGAVASVTTSRPAEADAAPTGAPSHEEAFAAEVVPPETATDEPSAPEQRFDDVAANEPTHAGEMTAATEVAPARERLPEEETPAEKEPMREPEIIDPASATDATTATDDRERSSAAAARPRPTRPAVAERRRRDDDVRAHDELPAAEGTHMTRRLTTRLGQLLLDEGILEETQLRAALEKQRQTGERLGALLVEDGYLDEPTLLSVLARQHGVPAAALDQLRPDRELVSLIPEDMARRNLIVPMARRADAVDVAMVDPTDFVAMAHVRFATGLRPNVFITSVTAARRAIARLYGAESPDEQRRDDARPLEPREHIKRMILERDSVLMESDQDPRKFYELAATIDAFVDEIYRKVTGDS